MCNVITFFNRDVDPLLNKGKLAIDSLLRLTPRVAAAVVNNTAGIFFIFTPIPIAVAVAAAGTRYSKLSYIVLPVAAIAS